MGTFQCVAKAAAGMMTLDGARETASAGLIVCTASVAAVDGQIGQCRLLGSKAGVAGMTLPIARDLMSEGIRINDDPAGDISSLPRLLIRNQPRL